MDMNVATLTWQQQETTICKQHSSTDNGNNMYVCMYVIMYPSVTVQTMGMTLATLTWAWQQQTAIETTTCNYIHQLTTAIWTTLHVLLYRWKSWAWLCQLSHDNNKQHETTTCITTYVNWQQHEQHHHMPFNISPNHKHDCDNSKLTTTTCNNVPTYINWQRQ